MKHFYLIFILSLNHLNLKSQIAPPQLLGSPGDTICVIGSIGWNASVGVQMYQFQIDTSPQFNSTVLLEDTTSARWKSIPDLFFDQAYFSVSNPLRSFSARSN
jgi:hypothetical protein